MSFASSSPTRDTVTLFETDRLALRHVCTDDAAFMRELVNEPSWLRFIGDRRVRTLEDAESYIARSFQATYERLGFGLYLVELKEDGAAAGICGLVKRDYLDDVDIGFAFLPRYWGKGYAYEAAEATLRHAREALGLARVAAITVPENDSSVRLLERLGMRLERTITPPGEDEKLRLYAIDFGGAAPRPSDDA
jgi:RimJ/RimL family protein N-acetyltransferase